MASLKQKLQFVKSYGGDEKQEIENGYTYDVKKGQEKGFKLYSRRKNEGGGQIHFV